MIGNGSGSEKIDASIISGADTEFTYKTGTEYARTTTTSGIDTQLTISTAASANYGHNKLLLGSPATDHDLSDNGTNGLNGLNRLNRGRLHDPSIDSPLFVSTPIIPSETTPQSSSNSNSNSNSNQVGGQRRSGPYTNIVTVMKSTTSESVNLKSNDSGDSNINKSSSSNDVRFQFAANNLKITIDNGTESDNGISSVIMDRDRDRNRNVVNEKRIASAISQPTSPAPPGIRSPSDMTDITTPRAKEKLQNERIRDRLNMTKKSENSKPIVSNMNSNNHVRNHPVHSIRYGINSPAIVFQLCFDKFCFCFDFICVV